MARVVPVVLVLVASTSVACSGNGNFPVVVLPSSAASVPGSVKVLDAEAVQQGVSKILKEKYNEDASDVHCPADQEVKVGNTFTCDLKVAGDPRRVTITVTSEDRAEYEVSQSS